MPYNELIPITLYVYLDAQFYLNVYIIFIVHHVLNFASTQEKLLNDKELRLQTLLTWYILVRADPYERIIAIGYHNLPRFDLHLIWRSSLAIGLGTPHTVCRFVVGLIVTLIKYHVTVILQAHVGTLAFMGSPQFFILLLTQHVWALTDLLKLKLTI